jgi:hypothetical protein
MESMACLEKSVSSYHYTQRNIPEERRSESNDCCIYRPANTSVLGMKEEENKNIRDDILKLSDRETFLKNEEMNLKNEFDELYRHIQRQNSSTSWTRRKTMF